MLGVQEFKGSWPAHIGAGEGVVARGFSTNGDHHLKPFSASARACWQCAPNQRPSN